MATNLVRLVLLAICLSLPLYGCGKGPAASPPAPLVAAENLAGTDVLPHTAGPIVAGRNYVYCATFQVAWNELEDRIVKGPVRLEGDPPMAVELGRRKSGKDDLPADAYLAMAGRVDEGLAGQIRQAMAERFPQATISVPEPQADSLFYVYAYLLRTLEFAEAFDRLPQPLQFASGEKTVPVAAFGFEHYEVHSERDEALGRQVSVLDYGSDDDFVLRLNAAGSKDEMVLAKVPPKATLDETIASVGQHIEESTLDEWERSLSMGEALIVPIVDVHVERAYGELVGKYLENPGWEKWYVSEARQGINFRLDETGARLESDAALGMKSAGREQPRRFVFDRPFLLYLKMPGRPQPYFAMWIETPEVLARSE
jgi:hypothetical protein